MRKYTCICDGCDVSVDTPDGESIPGGYREVAVSIMDKQSTDYGACGNYILCSDCASKLVGNANPVNWARYK